MSQKLHTILSEIATDCRALSVDDYISFRYIHSKFLSKIQYFLRLDAKSREILRDYTLWQSIDCVELEEVSSNSCGYINECQTLKRSVTQIPEAFNTSYGQLIKVFTLDGATELSMIKSGAYASYINREFKPLIPPYWIENKYLYIPNTELEVVSIKIIPKDPTAINTLNNGGCNMVLDSEVTYPDYLITLAKQETLKEISGIYKRMVEDEKGDNNTNIKN